MLLFEIYFFASPILAAVCVCFYVLGRSAMTPGLGRVPLYSTMGINGPVSLIILAGCFRDVPCVGYVDPLVVIESFFKDFIYLFLEKGEAKEEAREINSNVRLPLTLSQQGTWPATQACALTGN